MSLIAPKGLLRSIVLDQASKSPVTGVELMKAVEKASDGLWSPSPGSIYFLLAELERQGLITRLSSSNGNQYIVTKKGIDDLGRIKHDSIKMLDRQLLFANIFATLGSESNISEVIQWARRLLHLETSVRQNVIADIRSLITSNATKRN